MLRGYAVEPLGDKAKSESPMKLHRRRYPLVFTPKALHSAAPPWVTNHKTNANANGVLQRLPLCNAFSVDREIWALCILGCALRPQAMICNRYAVKMGSTPEGSNDTRRTPSSVAQGHYSST